MHKNSKHYKPKNFINKKKFKNWAIFLGILGVIILIFAITSKQSFQKEGQYDEFAKCLTNAGLKMYGTEWCPHCKAQKEIFGKSFSFVNYIDCDKNKNICNSEGIEGYPTWKLNGQSYVGTQPLSSLSEITKCTLE